MLLCSNATNCHCVFAGSCIKGVSQDSKSSQGYAQATALDVLSKRRSVFLSASVLKSEFQSFEAITYSVRVSVWTCAGKTTFIKHLLGREYPGIHIGPEPTTDRFVVVMHGLEERRTPGNTLIVQPDKPYQVLLLWEIVLWCTS